MILTTSGAVMRERHPGESEEDTDEDILVSEMKDLAAEYLDNARLEKRSLRLKDYRVTFDEVARRARELGRVLADLDDDALTLLGYAWIQLRRKSPENPLPRVSITDLGVLQGPWRGDMDGGEHLEQQPRLAETLAGLGEVATEAKRRLPPDPGGSSNMQASRPPKGRAVQTRPST
jgi:hypothetical protein